MIELEILVEIRDSYENAREKLKSFEVLKHTKIVDTYYYDPLRQQLKPDNTKKLYESFRVREKNDSNAITYKKDHYENDSWLYSDEYETSINNAKILKEILGNLGLKTLLVLESEKTYYKYKDYEIVLENVVDLGTFLEVELQKEISEDEVIDEKKKVQLIINKLGLNVSKELNAGKPELYLNKNHVKILE